MHLPADFEEHLRIDNARERFAEAEALTAKLTTVALRVDTKQTFNPKSVQKISRDEISTVQSA